MHSSGLTKSFVDPAVRQQTFEIGQQVEMWNDTKNARHSMHPYIKIALFDISNTESYSINANTKKSKPDATRSSVST
jgi:hypothetical protein